MNATARLSDLALSESGFVFDPYSGGTFTVNRAGMVILHALREGLARSGIIARLRTEFQVDDADLESDVGEFVRLLIQQGLLPADFTLESPTIPAAAESPPAVHLTPPASCLGPAAALAAEVPSGIVSGAGVSAGARVSAAANSRAATRAREEASR